MLKMLRDGVALAYEEAGQSTLSGSPPLVFVHGWSCDHRYFAPQIERFSPQHRTLAVDLRGHGVSDAPQQEYTMAGFADDVVWLCQQLGIEKPVIIGHSMGAVVALELAARYPDVPAGIIMVDGGTRTIATPAGTDPTVALAQVMRHAEDQTPVRQAIGNMFLPTDDPERRAWITEAMLSTPRHVQASAWEQLRQVNGVESARACKVPTMHIQAANPKPELDRFQELCPQAMLGRTVGAGHFNMLEVPDQVNAMISRFLALL